MQLSELIKSIFIFLPFVNLMPVIVLQAACAIQWPNRYVCFFLWLIAIKIGESSNSDHSCLPMAQRQAHGAHSYEDGLVVEQNGRDGELCILEEGYYLQALSEVAVDDLYQFGPYAG
jgi:hypothetical protein